MLGLIKNLLGGGGGHEAKPAKSVEHEGYVIEPNPIKEGGQYRLAGKITKEIGGETKTHSLIRADLFNEYDEAVKFTIMKAQQVIKEQGDNMFS